MWKRRRLRDKNRQIIFRDVSEKKSKRVDIAPIFLLQKFAEHAYIHDKYFRLIGWTLAEPNMVPNLREQSVDAAYWFFFEASFKLGRITDCDPKVGKIWCKLVLTEMNVDMQLISLSCILSIQMAN